MNGAEVSLPQMAESSKRFARGIYSLGSNRIELFMVELEEERAHLMHSIVMTMCAAVLALLSGIGLTATLVLVFWDTHPVAVLLSVSLFQAALALVLFWRVSAIHREWKMFPATLEQFKKDSQCLEKILS